MASIPCACQYSQYAALARLSKPLTGSNMLTKCSCVVRKLSEAVALDCGRVKGKHANSP